MAIKLTPGERRLWIETIVFLAGTGNAATWILPREDYLDFDDCNQAYFTIQYWVSGPGAANVTLDFQRTTQIDSPDQFESMLDPTGLVTFAGSSSGFKDRDVGRNTYPADKWPRGIGRAIFKNNNGTLANFAAVRVRIWITVQKLTATSGMAA
jgi:hypothetical protein